MHAIPRNDRSEVIERIRQYALKRMGGDEVGLYLPLVDRYYERVAAEDLAAAPSPTCSELRWPTSGWRAAVSRASSTWRWARRPEPGRGERDDDRAGSERGRARRRAMPWSARSRRAEAAGQAGAASAARRRVARADRGTSPEAPACRCRSALWGVLGVLGRKR
jgi:hypothetical protein